MADILSTLFSSKGRIARLPYFLYYIGLSFLGAVLSVGLGVLEKNSAPEPNQIDLILLISALLVLVIGIAMVVAFVMLTIKRLHDADRSGWLTLIGLIPLINLIFLLYLFFVKGTEGPNRFGPPPV